MQTAKNAAATAKETAANTAASAKAGMDKTKATVQEKVERMTAHDPMQKDMATERKQEKINQAECNKQGARENNAAARQAVATGGAGTFTAVGQARNSTPGAGTHGTQNYPAGGNNPGPLTASNPTGYGTGQHTHPTGGHNPGHIAGSNPTGYGTGQHTHPTGGHNPSHLTGSDATGYSSGQHTHPTGGYNPGDVTGSNATGYGTGQPTQNLGGVNLGGVDAVYPDDPIGSGPDATRNTTGGAPGMGHGTGGMYQ